MAQNSIYNLLSMTKEQLRKSGVKAGFVRRLTSEVHTYMASLEMLDAEITRHLRDADSVFALRSTMKSRDELVAELIQLRLTNKHKRILGANFFGLLDDSLVIRAYFRGKSNFKELDTWLRATWNFTGKPRMNVNASMQQYVDRNIKAGDFRIVRDDTGAFHADYDICYKHIKEMPRCTISVRRIEEALFEHSLEDSLAEMVQFQKKARVYVELVDNIGQAINKNAAAAEAKMRDRKAAAVAAEDTLSDMEATTIISRDKIKKATTLLGELAEGDK